jgi:ABC-type Fe3+ transport system substrate-binding protein
MLSSTAASHAMLLVLALTMTFLAGACGSPKVEPAPAAQSPEQPAAKAEWDRVLAAAKSEGRVVVFGGPGQVYREAYMQFQKAYPDIQLELTQGQAGRDLAPRLLAERQAGQYLWDALVSAPSVGYQQLEPYGVFQPLAPALIFPDLREDATWIDGFAGGWMDVDKEFIYAYEGNLTYDVWVNRDFVPESELRNIEQLVDPKWSGKVVWNDPRSPGAGNSVATYWAVMFGENFLRELWSYEVVVTSDLRQQAEWLVRGRYPIAIGPNRVQVQELTREGVGRNVVSLGYATPVKQRLTPGTGAIMLPQPQPHPNSAKVFVNWLLSREGQTAVVQITDNASRRVGVPQPSDGGPTAGGDFIIINAGQYERQAQQAYQLAREMIP